MTTIAPFETKIKQIILNNFRFAREPSLATIPAPVGMDIKIDFNVRPSGVSDYSTFGGIC